ncbi:glutathione S-transferase family protein [Mesorhizobium sp. BAC0120]|uniref:glutathione S-transferase family protein n=1 Tax=Mesorhizobium sp. BAC0120 TaxID=3090670 RepID=UPI00298C2273|nr:glutathione S-transferase family protein [Mesorhizobium sp. BAC0120]MDW6020174.1 glutathione S-transferase family protein [Mesorhizobium sp. BAC0120]
MMTLLNGPNTPFGRLAWVTALQLGIEVENRVIDVYSAGFLDALNPLRQIPTLVLDGNHALFDSRVICTYFHSLRPEAEIIPMSDWAVQTRWSLAVGLMEASVARTMEMRRQASERNTPAVAKHDQRIPRVIAALEAQAEEICDGRARIDRLATAVVLEYIDFRGVIDWRDTAPRLARWLENETTRPSLMASRPYDVLPGAAGDRSTLRSQMLGSTSS